MTNTHAPMRLFAAPLLVFCGVALPTFAAKADKVDLCHKTGKGYTFLSVNGNAVNGHLGHGDGLRPNGDVPGTPGHVFNSQCQAVTWDYAVNVAPDPSAKDPASPGNLFVGSGIPAANFATARNEGAGIELGLMLLYRQGPTIPSSDNYADGVLEYSVASGPQSTANGSSGDIASRAAWNFTFSIASGLNGVPSTIASHTYQLLYDVDPSPGTIYRTLTLEAEATPQPAGQSGYQWRDLETGLVYIADDEGTVDVTQNSQNYAFDFFQAFLTTPYGPGNGFAGPAQFDIILQALDGQQIIARNHIRVNVAP